LSAWLSEKLSRIKLGGQSENSLRTFEALEFLQLGIHHNTNLEATLNIRIVAVLIPEWR